MKKRINHFPLCSKNYIHNKEKESIIFRCLPKITYITKKLIIFRCVSIKTYITDKEKNLQFSGVYLKLHT